MGSVRTAPIALAGLLAALIGSAGAGAAPITWTFTGILQVIDGPVPQAVQDLGVTVGAPVHGTLSFTLIPDQDPNSPNHGLYDGAVVSANVEIGGWSVVNEGLRPADIAVGYYPLSKPPDTGEESLIYYVDPSGGYGYVEGGLELSAKQPGVFTSDALLVHPPSLSSLDPFGADPNTAFGFGSDLYLGLRPRNFTNPLTTLRASLTSLVPEPSLGALVALAALAGRMLRG